MSEVQLCAVCGSRRQCLAAGSLGSSANTSQVDIFSSWSRRSSRGNGNGNLLQTTSSRPPPAAPAARQTFGFGHSPTPTSSHPHQNKSRPLPATPAPSHGRDQTPRTRVTTAAVTDKDGVLEKHAWSRPFLALPQGGSCSFPSGTQPRKVTDVNKKDQGCRHWTWWCLGSRNSFSLPSLRQVLHAFLY